MSYFVWGDLQVVCVTLMPSDIAQMPNMLKAVFRREGASFTREEWDRMKREVSSRSYVNQFKRIIVFVDGEPEELGDTTGYGDPNVPLTVVLKAERRK